MRRSRLIATIISCLIACATSSPVLSQEGMASSMNRCDQAKRDYISTEHGWSFINTDVRFFRDELERLRNLRWEAKITLAVLDEGLIIMKEKGGLSDAQQMTLNSRIPSKKGIINPDGTFTISGYEGAPLTLDEAKGIIARLLARSGENIKKTESELKEKEKESHLLSQRLATLEELVEKECKAAGTPTPWEMGVPRSAGKDIYQRYVEKERLRQEEVEGRRLADIERLWLKNYYPPYLPYTYYPHH